ncbi:bifunctional 4-hydroxy-2-oxoglutarate aldolase/2-dehydro-3-deoxy-phosphogluconate aldolase [Tenacibaculum salmonis]|uniref:bifunctional 4-hydroxy-2-oxoglutarate aldolase/2-dehydro-3-deoxy-phosphogluconate aldolase n=1 Tax=Tenacibaculum sp. P3-BQ1 TaxID=3232310 RepID=UPI0034DFC3B5
MIQNNIREILKNNPVIPVVTFNSLDEIPQTVEKLLSKGIKCIEITLRTPISFEAIAKVKEEYGDVLQVGVGTVIHKNQIQKVKDLKADFIVSPGISKEMASDLEESDIPFIPGVTSPSEIMLGLSLGWDTFKFFPANLFGGTTALKTYYNVFPKVKFCPTGGVNEKTVAEYQSLSNVISVGGSWMMK